MNLPILTSARPGQLLYRPCPGVSPTALVPLMEDLSPVLTLGALPPGTPHHGPPVRIGRFAQDFAA